jgi:hypothetical protein
MAAPHFWSGGVLSPLSHWYPDGGASDRFMQRRIMSAVHTRVRHLLGPPIAGRRRVTHHHRSAVTLDLNEPC